MISINELGEKQGTEIYKYLIFFFLTKINNPGNDNIARLTIGKMLIKLCDLVLRLLCCMLVL